MTRAWRELASRLLLPHASMLGGDLVGRLFCCSPGPYPPDLPHHPSKLLNTPRRGILIGPPQTGTEQLITAEEIQRQIAIVTVIAMEETWSGRVGAHAPG